MSTVNWRYYNAPGANGIKLGRMASGSYDTNLVRAIAANYAQCRRNVICTMYNLATQTLTMPGPDEDSWLEWANLTIGTRINRPGNLKIYLHTDSTSELAANAIHCIVHAGQNSNGLTVQNLSKTWRNPINVTLSGPAICSPDEKLRIGLKTVGTNTLNIQGVSCYQPADTSAPAFVDLDGGKCHLGNADYPDSVRVMELLKDNCLSVRGYKIPKANVWTQWFLDWHKVGQAYNSILGGAANKDLGAYRFPKRAGVSEIKCHYLASELGAGNGTVRCEIADPDGVLDNAIGGGAAQENAIAGAALTWYTETWTFTGADITNERELELKVDAKHADAAGEVWVPGVYLAGTAPSTVFAHTVPDPNNVRMNSNIQAAIEHDNMRDTLNHLYFQGGKEILVADWRFAENGDGYTGQWHGVDAAWNNNMGNPAGVWGNTTACRAPLFSSTSSVRLRSRLEFSTDSQANATKTIQTSLSDTAARGVADYYEANPRYDNSTNNLHSVLAVIDGTSWRAVEDVYLDVRSADWEEFYDGANEPPQICLWLAGAAAGYIIPYQHSCEELELLPSEFP